MKRHSKIVEYLIEVNPGKNDSACDPEPFRLPVNLAVINLVENEVMDIDEIFRVKKRKNLIDPGIRVMRTNLLLFE